MFAIPGVRRRRCKADCAYYIAQQADAMAKRRYSNSRSKIQTRGTELERLDEVVSPLILKGQPLTHIFSEHSTDLGISQRTLYRYIEQGVLSVGNIDLRRKVAYKPRRKKKEASEAGKKRTKVFYCDPQASWQKPQIEKNHEFIRYVLLKGKTLNPYTQEDITVLMNNINRIRRESLGNKSPYEATTDKSIFRLMELMGLHRIPADEINLTPTLQKI